MPASYVTLWTQHHCRRVQMAGDKGPLSVIFGGPHGSLPTVTHLTQGDWLYVISVAKRRLRLIARMRIDRIVPIDEYTRQHVRVARGHRERWGCIDHVALGSSGTLFRFDREVPVEVVSALRLGPKVGQEMPLKHIENGLVNRTISLQGHIRRLSAESARLLEPLVESSV